MKFADALIALILVGSVTAVGAGKFAHLLTEPDKQVVARIRHDKLAKNNQAGARVREGLSHAAQSRTARFLCQINKGAQLWRWGSASWKV
jgi:hypothetical protein